MRRRALASRAIPRALIIAIALSTVLSTGLSPLRPADGVRAGTAASMQTALLGWINDARAARGLRALKVDGRLSAVASARIATLAATHQLSHAAAGCLNCQLADHGVAWNLHGEVLASNNWPWGIESARTAFEGWKGSPSHWDILMGAQMDTIGIGVALADDGVAYEGAVLIDAPGRAPASPKPAPAAAPRAPAPTPTPQDPPAPPEAEQELCPIAPFALTPC